MPVENDETENATKKKKRKKAEMVLSPLGVLVRVIGGVFQSGVVAMYNYEKNSERREKGLPEQNLDFAGIVEEVVKTIGVNTALGSLLMGPINQLKDKKAVAERVKEMKRDAAAREALGISSPAGVMPISEYSKG